MQKKKYDNVKKLAEDMWRKMIHQTSDAEMDEYWPNVSN